MIFASVPMWLDILAVLYLGLGILSTLIIIYDIFIEANRQMMPIMDFVWPITAFYLSLFGLWAYWNMGRPDSMNLKGMDYKEHMAHMKHMGHEKMHKKKEFWKSIFVSATHCGAGCELGDIVGEWSVFLFLSGVTIAGSLLYTEYVVDFLLAYCLGVMFQYIPIRSMKPNLKISAVLRDAITADSFSLIAFQIGLFGWMAIVTLILFGNGVLSPTMPVFWFMMQIGMLLGHFTSYPANWFLVKWGVKAGM